jgi:hypothetical protein
MQAQGARGVLVCLRDSRECRLQARGAKIAVCLRSSQPCHAVRVLRWRPSHGAYHGVHLPARLHPWRQRALLLGAGVCVESADVANCVGQLTLSAAHVPLPLDLRSDPSALRTHLGVTGVCPDNDLQLATSRCVQCATCSVQHAPCAPGVQEPDGRKDGHRQPPLHVHKHLRKRQSRAAPDPTARPNVELTPYPNYSWRPIMICNTWLLTASPVLLSGRSHLGVVSHHAAHSRVQLH